MLHHDLRYAARCVRRSPVSTAILMLTLALGVGANTAILTVTSAVLWKQLPYRAPDRLMSLFSRRTDREKAPLSIADAQDFRAGSALVEDIGLYAPMGANLTGAGEPVRLEGVIASPNLFEVLGVQLALGRALRPGDGPRTVVLSHALGQRGLSEVSLNGENYTVVGILREDFCLPIRADFVAPMNPETDVRRADRGDHFLSGIARLRADATPLLAEQQLTAVARRLQAAYPSTNSKNSGVRVIPLAEEVAGNFALSLRSLAGAAGVLLVLACASLASLSLARIAARGHEFAIRASLGARRRALAGQVVTEMLLVALAG